MAEESTGPFDKLTTGPFDKLRTSPLGHSDLALNPTVSVPTQSELGLPPMSSLGSVSSMPAAQYGWHAPPGHASNAMRAAAAEAALGDAHFRRQEFVRAMERYWRAIDLDPSNGAYFLSVGATAALSGRPDLAERNMLEAVRLSPSSGDAHEALAQLYMESRQLDRALKHSETALLLDPRDIDYVVTRGAVLTADGQTTAAWELIKPLLDAGARHPRLALLYAKLAPGVGRNPQALAEVKWALQAGVHRWIEPRFHFAAATLLDRLERYDEAFEHARRANELAARAFDPLAVIDADRKIAYFTPQCVRCLPKSTLDSRRIVFIVGMPRSGTTLVEQVLASHPQVFGGGESPALHDLYQNLCDPTWADGAAFPNCLDSLSVAMANRLARRYLSAVESPAAGNAVYVTDKTPLNCLHLGLVQLLVPDCRVIHCTRSPLDTCLSCYFTDFTSGHEYSHDLGVLGAVFRQYHRLMANWKQVLTIPIHEVRYEDLVLDLESQSRRITDFLNLPWDDRCLKFYENPRRVRSASQEQVRRPIYLSSIGRWKNYQKHVAKLIEALAT
jgi:tetratricopeptide (TPR) repeat protein